MKIHLNALILLNMAIFLFGAASNTQSGWQYIISSILFSLLLIGFIVPQRKIKGINVFKFIPPRIYVGKDVTVELTIKNHKNNDKNNFNIIDKPIKRPKVDHPEYKGINKLYYLYEKIYEGLFKKDLYKLFYEYFIYKDYTAEYFVRKLQKQELIEYKTSFIPNNRGVFISGETIVYDSSPFGLFTFKKAFKNDEEIVVYPKILAIRGGWVNRIAQKSIIQDLAYSYMPTNMPGTTRNLRDYVPGDSPRHIHWPSSAKNNKLMVREFEIEASGFVVIILDSSNEYKNRAYYELAVTTTASLLNICHSKSLVTRFVTQDDSYNYDSKVDDCNWEHQLEILARVNSISNKPVIELIDNIHNEITKKYSRTQPTYVLISSKYKASLSRHSNNIVSIIVSPDIVTQAHYNITSEEDLKHI